MMNPKGKADELGFKKLSKNGLKISLNWNWNYELYFCDCFVQANVQIIEEPIFVVFGLSIPFPLNGTSGHFLCSNNFPQNKSIQFPAMMKYSLLNFVPIFFLLFLILFSKNGQGARRAGENGKIRLGNGNEELIRPIVATTKKPRRTTPHHHHHSRTTHRPTDYDDDDEEGSDLALVTVGPIIIPTDSSGETDESDLYDDDDEDGSEEHLRPSHDRAGNCHSLFKLCHQHAYRRLLQRFCQTTCGRDDCLDQREDLCIHWKHRGFCTKSFYREMRWKCARSCGICRPIHS